MKISIIGSFQYPNFGDELLLEVIAGMIKDFTSDTEIHVPFCHDGIKLKANAVYGGKEASIKSSDLVIFGGGGYLGENPNYKELPLDSKWSFDRKEPNLMLKFFGLSKFIARGAPLRKSILSFYRYYRVSRMCKRNNVPYVVFGSGCGPFSSIFSRFLVRKIISSCRKLSSKGL